MFRNILNTTIVRIFNALVSFAVLMVTARMLGPHDLGTIGLILLAITVILMLNNLVGGGAMVFLVPRYSLKKIVEISYIWSVISTFAGILVFVVLKIEPVQYTLDILLLSLVFGINFVNQNILIGKGAIRFFNLISFIQYMLLIVVLLMLFMVIDKPSIENYLLSLYISWGLQLILGTLRVIKLMNSHTVHTTKGLIPAVLKYGFFVQIANLTQFFNYRLSYYFVEYYLGRAKLGVFEIGNKLADGVWLFGKSISMVQYSWIANANENDDTVSITLRLFRFSIIMSLLMVVVLVALPEEVYLSVFGAKFTGIHKIILYLSPGIVAMSGAMILAHHFAGTGKHYLNTIGSLIGLVTIVISCFLLVPSFGLPGAAIAASITYLISLVYNVVMFQIKTGVHWSSYWFSSEDYYFIKNLIRKQSGLLSK